MLPPFIPGWFSRASSKKARRNVVRPSWRLEVLEDRTVFAIAELPAQQLATFASLFMPVGLATDATKVYVAASDLDALWPSGQVHAFNALGQSTGSPFPAAGTIPIGTGDTQGTLFRLRAGMTLSAGTTALQEGDLLNLLPDGRLFAIRPSTGGAALLINLKQLISKSKGLLVSTVDNTDIYDVYTGARSNFGGVILPEAAQTAYNDLSVYKGSQFTDIFVSGVSSLPFVMRLRYQNGQFHSAKVLAASTGTVGWIPTTGDLTTPVAVNDQGVVLTTLPMPAAFPNQNFAVFTPIAFDVGFPEGSGRAPFQPFAFDYAIPKGELSGRLHGAGITTDSRGHFIIAPTTAQNAASTRSGYYVITGNLSDLYFVPYTGSALTLHQSDAAVSFDDQTVYFSTNMTAQGFYTWVLKAPLPSLPGGQRPDLAGHQLTGWDGPLVVSTQTGTNRHAGTITTVNTVYIDWTVINRGNAGITGSFETQLFLDDLLKQTWTTNAPLGPNWTTGIQDYNLGTLTAGNHVLRLVIDPQNAQAESEETNNTVTYPFTVSATSTALPDLAPYQPDGWSGKLVLSTAAGTSTDATTLSTTDELFIDWALINQGTAGITAPFHTRLVLDDVEIGYWITRAPFGVDEFGGVQDVRHDPLAAGAHTLKLIIDVENEQNEANETNNVHLRPFEVNPPPAQRPDLTPYQPPGWDSPLVISTQEDTHVSAGTITTNDMLYIDWSVINQGLSDLTGEFHSRLLLDGQVIGWFRSPLPFVAGAWTAVPDVAVSPLAAGSHTLELVVDSLDEQGEADENNNVFRRTFTVSDAAHGTARYPVFAVGPGSTLVGEKISPFVTVHLLDDQFRLVTTENAAWVTLEMASGPGRISGTLTVRAVNGVATFTDLFVTEPGTYTLRATSNGLTSATSPPFDVRFEGDTFDRADSSILGAAWTRVVGSVAIQNLALTVQGASSGLALFGARTLADTRVATSVVVANGQTAGVVARYGGPGDRSYYFAALVGTRGRFEARIYRNFRGIWGLLTSRRVSSGTGTLTFEAVGSSLKLFFDSGSGTELVAAAHDTRLPTGRVGVRATRGAKLDGFLAGPVYRETATLPFVDTFSRPDTSQLSRAWLETRGNFAITGGALVARAAGVSAAKVNGLIAGDAVIEADVQVRAGQLAGLVAHWSGPGDANAYVARLTGVTATTFTVSLWRNVNGTWRLLGSRSVSSGTGKLRLVLQGPTLTVSFEGTQVLQLNDYRLPGPAAVGVQATMGAIIDQFQVGAV